jgi:hypothetical protein
MRPLSKVTWRIRALRVFGLHFTGRRVEPVEKRLSGVVTRGNQNSNDHIVTRLDMSDQGDLQILRSATRQQLGSNESILLYRRMLSYILLIPLL